MNLFNNDLLYLGLNFELSSILLYAFCLLLIIVSICLIFSYDLIRSIILMSLLSIIFCICYLLMDAPDVAMTEASLGVCLSTAIFLKTIKTQKDTILLPSSGIIQTITSILICSIFAILLITLTLYLPDFGTSDTALHQKLSKYYIENTRQEIGINSFVAAILASYRGYDTIGETTVIFCAGISVALIFANKRKNYEK